MLELLTVGNYRVAFNGMIPTQNQLTASKPKGMMVVPYKIRKGGYRCKQTEIERQSDELFYC